MEGTTDKDQADQKSRASELYYLIDNLDVGFFQVTLDGQIVNHNRAHNVILGYEPSESLIGKNVEQFWQNPKEREIYIDALLKNDAVKNYRVLALTKDGKKIVVELNSRLIRDETGNPIRIDGTFNDITEKNLLEKKVKESEEKFRSLFDFFPHFIGLMDMNGKLVDCNPATNKFLSKHRREDIIGLNFIKILSIFDKNKILIPKFEKLLKEVKEGRELKKFEFKISRSAGGFLWLRIEGSSIRINDQRLIQFIIQDITSRKITEEKLQKSEDNLKGRVKELSFLYKLSKLIESPLLSEEAILQGTIELIPEGIKYSEITCARISFKAKIYSSINFEESKWKISTSEMIDENNLMLQVYYLENRPFLKEENDLIREIGIRLKTSLEQREAQRRLNESEEKSRDLVNSISDLLLEVDLKGKFTYASPQIYDMFGFTPSEIINKSMRKFIHPDDILKVLEALKEAYHTREAITIEYRTLHKDGHYVYASAKGSLLDNDRFYGVVRDISKRKIVEQELRESEEKYRLISETAYDLISVLNKQFKYEYINESAFYQLLGYSKEDVLGQSALKLVHPDDVELAAKSLVNGFNEGMGEAELRLKHKDGHWVWFEVRGKTFLDKNGDLKALLISRDFSERKRTLEKLKESEERYRLISQNAEENLFIFDMNLNLIYNDTSVPNILGYSYEEMRNLKLIEYNTPASLKTTFQAYKEELGSERKKIGDPKRIRTFEVEQIHKNGSILNVETRFTFLRDENGIAKGILGLSRNITKRKQVEQKLRESEEKYRLISETAYDLIGVLNNKFKYEYINEGALKQLLGYKKGEILGESALKFIHPDDLELAAKYLSTSFKKGGGEAEVRLKHKNGSWVWFEVRGKTFLDKDGETKALLILRDFTERKEAMEKLRESEERYRLIIQNADENLFIFDMNLNLIYNDPNVPNILGYTNDEISKLKLPDYNEPSSLKTMLKAYREELRNERKKLKDPMRIRSFEIEQIHKNGSLVNVEVKFTFLRDDKGIAKGIISISRDISKRKQAEQELRESEKKYHESYNRANFYKDLFAHDINNILQIITSSAELISIQLGNSEKSKMLRNLTKIINQQVERGGKLVKNVHTLSKLEEENIIVQPIKIDETLRKSIEFIKKSYEDRHLHIQVDSTHVDFIVQANLFLQDVFENILINGVKYNENPNIDILIRISKVQIDNKELIRMEFIDNGIGVPDDRKEIIFKKGNRKLKGKKGMGLGLSLVSKIISSFNGKIWVKDKIEGDYSKGSNFIVELPIKK